MEIDWNSKNTLTGIIEAYLVRATTSYKLDGKLSFHSGR